MSLTTAGREARRVIAMQLRAAFLLVLLCTGCGGAQRGRIVSSVQFLPYPADPGPADPRTASAVAVTMRDLRSFQLMEEKDTSSSPPGMHMPWGWTKLNLLFTTADRRGYVMVQDDGGGVMVAVEVWGCHRWSRYYRYGERKDESHLYDAMASNFRDAIRNCRRPIERADEYRRQLRHARADFPAAISAMKTRAVELFHTLTPRCQTPDPRIPVYPQLGAPCQ